MPLGQPQHQRADANLVPELQGLADDNALVIDERPGLAPSVGNKMGPIFARPDPGMDARNRLVGHADLIFGPASDNHAAADDACLHLAIMFDDQQSHDLGCQGSGFRRERVKGEEQRVT